MGFEEWTGSKLRIGTPDEYDPDNGSSDPAIKFRITRYERRNPHIYSLPPRVLYGLSELISDE